jgi:hypothetical protein
MAFALSACAAVKGALRTVRELPHPASTQAITLASAKARQVAMWLRREVTPQD